MGLWSELFGLPKCDVSIEELKTYNHDNNYMNFNKLSLKKIENIYEEICKNADGDLLVYEGYKHKLSGVLFNNFRLVDCYQYISFCCGDSCSWNHIVRAPHILNQVKVSIKPEHVAQPAFNFLKDFLKHGVVEKSVQYKIRKKYQDVGFVGDVTRVGIKGEVDKKHQEWVEVNNGEYYVDDYGYMYRFSDWKILGDDNEIWSIIEKATLSICGDPHKTHWKHFIELEMLKKNKRDNEMKEWVSGILSKKVEYDDLNLKYNNLPSAPIINVDSFRNFCRLVSEPEKYEDYEVSNYLMLIRNGRIGD